MPSTSVSHVAELPYTFPGWEEVYSPSCPLSGDHLELARAIRKQYAEFIASHAPWPGFRPRLVVSDLTRAADAPWGSGAYNAIDSRGVVGRDAAAEWWAPYQGCMSNDTSRCNDVMWWALNGSGASWARPQCDFWAGRTRATPLVPPSSTKTGASAIVGMLAPTHSFDTWTAEGRKQNIR